MNLVRSLNKHYGGIGERIPIMACSAFIGTTVADSYKASRSFNFYYQSLVFYMKVWAMEWADWFMQKILGRNLENYVED